MIKGLGKKGLKFKVTGIAQTVECLPGRHHRSWFQAQPMPTCRYVEEYGLAAMLAANMSAGVTLEVNLRECVMHMPPPSVNKAAHSGPQKPSPEVQNRGISGPTKTTYVLQTF